MGNALGATLEFSPPGSFTPIDDMLGGGPFHLKPGGWTGDTSIRLRRDIRAKLRPVSRELSRSPQADPRLAALTDYCEGLRDAWRSDGLSPFELAGLDLDKGLQRLETSLRHCEKKGILFCPPC